MQKVLVEYIAKWKPAIDAGIALELSKRKQEVGELAPQLTEIVIAMEELSVGGKRLRGILTLLGYEAAGKEVDGEAVQAAVAMEIFHLGLMIHDDIMDQDELRRGVATIHSRYKDKRLGETLAILAGDYCFAWTSAILTELVLPARSLLAGLSVWNTYFRRVGYGQTLDVWTESRGEISESEILQVLSLKSGEYSCVLPLVLGATLGEAEDNVVARLGKLGMELGLVLQLRDDYLAEYGDSKKTGKPVGGDSREGKKTLVTMYGKEKSEAILMEHWEKGKELTESELMLSILEYVATREN
jgi:geranylgeranyl diphosphate synthase, type I